MSRVSNNHRGAHCAEDRANNGKKNHRFDRVRFRKCELCSKQGVFNDQGPYWGL